MIITPVADLDVVIRDTLRELRSGIAIARQKNQINPSAGLMADLPEFVDFEIQVITGHQALQRSVVGSDTSSGVEDNQETGVTSGNVTKSDSSASSDTRSGTRNFETPKSIVKNFSIFPIL